MVPRAVPAMPTAKKQKKNDEVISLKEDHDACMAYRWHMQMSIFVHDDRSCHLTSFDQRS